MTHQSKRLAIVLSHPTQYYSPWFRWMAANSSIQIRVFYLWDFGITETFDPRFNKTFKWDVDLLSGYDSEFSPNAAKHKGAESFFGFRNPDLHERIRQWTPDAILLFGYNWYTHVRLILWASSRKIPLILRGDSHSLGRQKPSALKRAILSSVLRRFSAISYVGQANKEFFKQFGVPDSKLFFAPHSVNEAHFDASNPETREKANALRASWGAQASTKIVLFAGKLRAEKGPLELARAFLKVDRPDTMLVIAGAGELATEAGAIAAAAPRKNIHLLPFANQLEMPSRYLSSDLFALPSRSSYETWGLAVNEAMHMGIPCLVSDLVGCQRDLVEDGVTGWVADAQSESSLGDKLREAFVALDDGTVRARMKAAVADRIGRYTFRQTTEGVLAALTATAHRQA